MSWRDQLRPASFRGVPFHYRDAGRESGRRVVVHEYPLRDEAETEDLGGKAVQLAIDGYVIGPDYLIQRDRLEAALDAAGPGTLVHPYRGEIEVAILSVRIEESTREGGLARFQIAAVIAVPVKAPLATVDTRAATQSAAAVASAAVADRFEAAYTPTRGLRLPEAISLVDQALTAASQAIGEAEAQRAAAAVLVNTPATLALRLQGLVGRATRLAQLRGLFGFRLPGTLAAALPGNAAATQQLLQTSAVIAAAERSSTTEFSSYEQASTLREELVDELDRVSLAADDTTYAALITLRVRIAEDLRVRAADLARLTRYTPATTLPALAIAQRLYGPAAVVARAEDLCARNAIRHPGFVPGGVALEVLSD